jgi:hypothetical protein
MSIVKKYLNLENDWIWKLLEFTNYPNLKIVQIKICSKKKNKKEDQKMKKKTKGNQENLRKKKKNIRKPRLLRENSQNRKKPKHSWLPACYSATAQITSSTASKKSISWYAMSLGAPFIEFRSLVNCHKSSVGPVLLMPIWNFLRPFK